MVGWYASRLVGFAARQCGASTETADAVRMMAAVGLTLVDPIGGAIGVAHSIAATEAHEGNQTAASLNQLGNVAAFGTCFLGGVSASGDSITTDG
ncbi:hypothetical protein KOR42_36360 [Thalassoglobus neptunius]|uniref:Uncharacterized protein n=1 Tax=Thalassoglobus neptunius TaxID=1938619 RepID=A0A5C5WHF5_9PLAN|nr:hypothetical protein [Thalassoglobus neptunius]TWT50090.1 hypothetical protein KOR42_36360 [Thalassoglobus neptunius]